MTRSPEPPLEVDLLGPFRVQLHGRDVTEDLVGRSRHVFQQLVLAGGPVVRDVLLDALWPDFDLDRARNNLNVAITGIRRALGSRDVIRHRCGSYRIDPSLSVSTDVHEFTELVRQAHEHDVAGRTGEAIVAYRAAVSRYGGELLPEERYAEWVAPRRTFLQHAYLDALKRLAVLSRAHGDLFEASWAAQLGLLADDLDEELVEEWLCSLAERRATRQLTSALHVYSRRLEDQLGLTPSPRLLALLAPAS